ncbi:MAG: N-acetyltransferase family protein [Ruthenibacterium sp.]
MPDGWSGQAIAEYAAMPAARCFVAVSGQQVCGFAAFTVPRAGKFGCVERGARPPPWRGRALLGGAFQALRAQGTECVFLEVRTQTPARALYHSLGLYKQEFEKGLYKSERRRHFDEAAA